MNVTVNGTPRQIEAELTILQYIELLGLEAERVAIEYNRAILPRAEFARQTLAEGDSLEIIQFVGGG